MRPFSLRPDSIRMKEAGVRKKFAIKDGYENIFHLGCFSQRATIASQQQRALNLAWALNEDGMLEDKKVAIIGAGFAGIMFAAALKVMTKKCDFHLYDKHGQILFLQRGNATRFIQPYIYDWPAKYSRYPKTFFPYLNWDSGTAGEIVEIVEKQWKRLKIKVEKREASLIHSGNMPVVEWKSSGSKTEKEEFDFVVLSVGFGIETQYLRGYATSYWNNDSLNQSHLGKNSPAIVLVSGHGDGGLIDACRAAIKDFNHAKFTAALLDIEEMLYEEFVDTVTDASKSGKDWDSIQFPEPLLEKVRKLIRDDTRVFLNYRNEWFSNKESALINRVMVAVLAKLKAIEFEPGSLRSEKVDGDVKHYLNSNAEPLCYDHFVLRHGVKSECAELFRQATQYLEKTDKEWEFEKKNPLLDETMLSHCGDDFLVDHFMPYRKELEYEVVYAIKSKEDLEDKVKKIGISTEGHSEFRIHLLNMREAKFLWPQQGLFYDMPCKLGSVVRVTTKSRKMLFSFLRKMKDIAYYSYGIKVSDEFFCEEKPETLPFVPIRFPGAAMQLTIDCEPGESNDTKEWWLRIIQRHPDFPLKDAHGLMSADDMLEIARYDWSLKKMIIVGWRMIESPDSNFVRLSKY